MTEDAETPQKPESMNDQDLDHAQGGLSINVGRLTDLKPKTEAFINYDDGGGALKPNTHVMEPGPNEEELMAIKPRSKLR
ncbi:MAG: hypothetical protein AAGH74_11030 [Pseudomonadota bacterium]